MRSDFIIPFITELISDDLIFRELVIRNLQSIGVVFFVQISVSFEACFGASAGDQIDDKLQCLQTDALPVAVDVTKQTIFDPVPFACARREMTHVDQHAFGVGQPLLFQSPESSAGTIVAFTVSSDQQTSRKWDSFAARFFPSAFDHSAGELRGVMADAHANERFVVLQIMNPVGNGIAQFLL